MEFEFIHFEMADRRTGRLTMSQSVILVAELSMNIKHEFSVVVVSVMAKCWRSVDQRDHWNWLSFGDGKSSAPFSAHRARKSDI